MTAARTFWNNNHPMQGVYERLWKKLVPLMGDAETVRGQLLRFGSNLYRELYNNGGCNVGTPGYQEEVDCLRKFKPELQRIMLDPSKLDEVIDKCQWFIDCEGDADGDDECGSCCGSGYVSHECGQVDDCDDCDDEGDVTCEYCGGSGYTESSVYLTSHWSGWEDAIEPVMEAVVLLVAQKDIDASTHANASR